MGKNSPNQVTLFEMTMILVGLTEHGQEQAFTQ
jgi:hypothetical protein